MQLVFNVLIGLVGYFEYNRVNSLRNSSSSTNFFNSSAGISYAAFLFFSFVRAAFISLLSGDNLFISITLVFFKPFMKSGVSSMFFWIREVKRILEMIVEVFFDFSRIAILTRRICLEWLSALNAVNKFLSVVYLRIGLVHQPQFQVSISEETEIAFLIFLDATLYSTESHWR